MAERIKSSNLIMLSLGCVLDMNKEVSSILLDRENLKFGSQQHIEKPWN